jgi:predicted regulator of Ras-like GTPase activity (Roadblock/LC7/MglB family)
VSQGSKANSPTVIHTLVVVGDPLLQRAIEQQIQHVGHASLAVDSVSSAIERLRREPFDVVLCELHPSGSEGMELLQYMGGYYPSTPVVVICEAMVGPEFRGQYEGGGSVRIVEKPINMTRLVEIIEECGPKKGFYGNQIEVEFFDYVQMIAISGRDKMLVVTTRQGNGYIWFEHGDIVHAQYGEIRGEQAFYKLLAVGRGTYREVLFRPPTARTIVRPSMHLLMEAARQSDEGILGTSETVEAEDEKPKKPKQPEPEPEPPPSASDSMAMSEAELVGPSTSQVKPIVKPVEVRPEPRARAPMPKPERPAAATPTSPAKPPPQTAQSPTPSRRSDGPSIDMAGLADSAIARLDDLGLPTDDDEVEATRVRQAPSGEVGDGVPLMKRRPAVTTLDKVIARATPVSLPAVNPNLGPSSGRPTPVSTRTAPQTPVPAPIERRDRDRNTPTSTPASRPPSGRTGTQRDATTAPRPGTKPIQKATTVDLLDDPETRDLMLGQFWQFEGVNGVAIISSTGKVIAEDMRNNGTVVTLAGFYMRGAARIARTLGYNVFDGVIARAANGQQMIMVGMGATSAVLSVAAGHDPEVIRDAIMGVDKR